MKAKEKCNRLKELRRLICIENGISFNEKPCPFSGEDCIGTCSKCDQELRRIARILAERRASGDPVDLEAARNSYHSWTV